MIAIVAGVGGALLVVVPFFLCLLFGRAARRPAHKTGAQGNANAFECAEFGDGADLRMGTAPSSPGKLAAWRVAGAAARFMRPRLPSPYVPAPGAAAIAFLSHDWGEGCANHKRVERIYAALRDEHGLNCWIDTEEMHGNLSRQMAKGIDTCPVFIAFITSAYMRKVAGEGPNGGNDNCKFEFDYALRRKGVDGMVPVLMDAARRSTKEWWGPVGGWLGGNLYIDITSDEPSKFADGVGRLAAEIRRLLAGTATGPTIPSDVDNMRAQSRSTGQALRDQSRSVGAGLGGCSLGGCSAKENSTTRVGEARTGGASTGGASTGGELQSPSRRTSGPPVSGSARGSDGRGTGTDGRSITGPLVIDVSPTI